MKRLLPPGIWDNPKPEELQAYNEFVLAYLASEGQYLQFYQAYLQEDSPDVQLRALAYSCVTRGLNTKVGHHVTADIPSDAGDGWWYDITHDFETDQNRWGISFVYVAQPGVSLPPSEELPPIEIQGSDQTAFNPAIASGAVEPVLSAQHEGEHEIHSFYFFSDVQVPNSAKIHYAYIELVAKNVESSTYTGSVRATIGAEDSTSPTAPTDTISASQLAGRLTSYRVFWNHRVDDWTSGTTYETSNIACVIQQIVDKPGWSSGNNIQIVFLGDSTNTSYGVLEAKDVGDGDAPILHIYYASVITETMSGGVLAGGRALVEPEDFGTETWWMEGLPSPIQYNSLLFNLGTETRWHDGMPSIIQRHGGAERYYQPVGGGILVDGEAVVVKTSGSQTYNETMSGGVKLNGEARFNVIRYGLASGGIKLNSTAGNTVYDYNISLGGVKLNSTSYAPFSDVIEVGGGIRLNGAARQLSYHGIQMSGGIRLNGAARQLSYHYILMGDGVKLNGACFVETKGTYNEVMSGGVKLNGSARQTSYHAVVVSGGLKCSGDGVIFAIYNAIRVFAPNLLWNYASQWTPGSGGTTNYSANGQTVENERFAAYDPWNKETVVWEGRPTGDGTSSDGGWNSSYLNIDRTKMYRWSVWVNRTVQGDGYFYLGCRAITSGDATTNIITRSTGATTNNPYFISTNTPGNDWFLFVGHVWPEGSGTGANHPDTGKYSAASGLITNSGFSNFVWASDNAKTMHRSYLYYCYNSSTRQRWCYPRLDLIDGNEPGIRDLLANMDIGDIGLFAQADVATRVTETVSGGIKAGGAADIFVIYNPTYRNLAPYVDYINRIYGNVYTADSWSGDAGTVTYYASGGPEDLPYKKLVKTVGGAGGSYKTDHAGIEIEDNTEYIVSAYMKADRTININPYALDLNRISDNAYRVNPPDISLTTNWQKISWKYTSGTGHAGTYQSRQIIYHDSDLPLEIYWAGFTVEKNNGSAELDSTARQVVYDYNIMSGGIKLNGECFVEKKGTYNETMSGGVKLNGSAQNTVYDYNVSTGGVQLNSTSYAPFRDVVEVGGGIKLNGTGVVNVRVNPTAFGGARANGTAAVTVQLAQIISGGAKLNGSTEPKFVYNFYGGSWPKQTGVAIIKESPIQNGLIVHLDAGNVNSEPTTNEFIGSTWTGDGSAQGGLGAIGYTVVTDPMLQYNGYETVLYTPGTSYNCYLHGSGTDVDNSRTSTDWTFSCYIKREDGGTLGASNNNVSIYLYFPSSDGSALATVEDCGHGWYRVSRTRTGSNNYIALAGITSLAPGYRFYLSGWQLEKKEHPTPVVPINTSRNWIDLAGGDNNGVLTNGPTFNVANGGSVVFDGAGDYVECGTVSNANPSSYTVWFYISGLPSDSRIIFSDNNNHNALGFYNNDSLILKSSSTGTETQRRASRAGIVVGWNSVTVTYDGSGVPTCYINGDAALDYLSNNYWTNYNNTLWIGGRNTSLGGSVNTASTFGGRIAVFQTYDRALSANEVRYNFEESKERFGIPRNIADINVIYRPITTGGVTVDGSVPAITAYNPRMEAGLLCNSTARTTFVDQIAMTGGAKLNGQALVISNAIYYEVMNGGVKLNSTSYAPFRDVVEVGGGIKLNGSARATFYHRPSVTGGVQVDGTLGLLTNRRYWVGTSTSWTDPNNWSDTSGGDPGAPVPTINDRVFFDGNGVFNCTLSGNVNVKTFDMDCDTYTGTFTDAGYTLTAYGSLRIYTISSGVDRTVFTGTLRIAGDGAFTVNRDANYGYRLEIADNVNVNNAAFTANYGNWIMGRKIVLGSNCTVANAVLSPWNNYENNPIEIAATATVYSSTTIRYYSVNASYNEQNGYTTQGDIFLNYGSVTLKQTGNISARQLVIHGGSTNIGVWDTNGYELNLSSSLILGLSTGSTPDRYRGEIYFRDANHSIGGSLQCSGQYSRGYIHFGSGEVSVETNLDFRYCTISNQGTGTVALSGSSNQNIYGDGVTICNLWFNKSGGIATFQSNLGIINFNGDSGDCNLNGTTLTASGNVSASKGSGFRFWNGTDTSMSDAVIDYDGDLTLAGSSGDLLYITDLDFINSIADTPVATYCYVTNSIRTGTGPDISALKTALGGTNVDNGGNVGWDFGEIISIDMSGGVKLDGTAPYSKAYTAIPAGGLKLNGTSIVVGTYTYEPYPLAMIPIPMPKIQNRKPNCRPNVVSQQYKGLVGWWINGEPGGNRIYDPVGNHIGEAEPSGSWVTSGERGGFVYELNGSTEYINCGYSRRLNFYGADLTVSVWAKPDTYPGSGYEIILSKPTDYEIGINSSGQVCYHFEGNAWVNSGRTLPTTQWTLITLIRKSGTATLYLNGEAS